MGQHALRRSAPSIKSVKTGTTNGTKITSLQDAFIYTVARLSGIAAKAR